MSDIVVFSAEQERQLAAALGAGQQQGGGNRIPVLKVNADDEDDSGRPLPKGSFFISDQEVTVYGKTVRIRPLAEMFQYQDYNAVEKKVVNKTVLVPSFRDELIDEKGGVRCGKPASKVLKENPDLAEKYKSITCYRMVYCLVSYDGETVTGEKVTVENVPALLRLKGANFSPFEDEFRKRLPKGQNLWNFWATVSATRKKNGSVTYYVMGFDPNIGNPVQLDTPTFESIKALKDMIDADNERVRQKHMGALRGRQEASSSADIIDLVEGGSDDGLELPE